MRKNLYDVYENDIRIREKMTSTDAGNLLGIKPSAIFAAMDRQGVCKKHGNKYSFKLVGVCGAKQGPRDLTVVTSIKPKMIDYKTMTEEMEKEWINMTQAKDLLKSGWGKIVTRHGIKQVVRC